MKPTRILRAALLCAVGVLALTGSARADYAFTVTLNTSALSSLKSGPFSLDLQFDQGSGNVTNTVKLFNFSFVGGAAASAPDWISGNATGSLSTSSGIVTLTNSSNVNEFANEFSSSVTQISFNVDETTNAETSASGTPVQDELNIAVLDANLDNVPTTDPTGYNTVVTSVIGKKPSLEISTLLGSSTSAPIVITATPEPVSGWLGVIAAGGMIGLLRFRSRRA